MRLSSNYRLLLNSISNTVFEILCSKCEHVSPWRHQSRDHLITRRPFPIGGPTKSLSLTVSEIFNVECNALVDMTLIQPLNKGQGHSFWYQSISHIRLLLAVSGNFCSRTHRLATIHSVQTSTDRETHHCSISATVLIQSAKKRIGLFKEEL